MYDDPRTYLYAHVCWKKINKIISFNVRNTCMKHKFGNFTYEYYLKGELSIFCSFFAGLLLYHIHGGHDKLNYDILQFYF